MRDFVLTGEEEKKEDSSIRKLQKYGQDKQFELVEETITAETIDEREIKIQNVSGVVKLVTKIEGTILRWTSD